MARLRVAGVIFDMDDTLVLERDYAYSGYRTVARELASQLGEDADQLFAELASYWDSPERPRAFNALLRERGREDLVSSCIDVFRHHEPDITLKQAASAMIRQLAPMCPLGVVTDGPEVMQAAKSRALGLTQLGLHVVLTDRLGGRAAWKPAPDGLLEACRRMAVPVESCVYVADNPHKDFLAARRAGMRSVRYRTLGQVHNACDAEPGAEADREVNSLLDLRGILAVGPWSDPTSG